MESPKILVLHKTGKRQTYLLHLLTKFPSSHGLVPRSLADEADEIWVPHWSSAHKSVVQKTNVSGLKTGIVSIAQLDKRRSAEREIAGSNPTHQERLPFVRKFG